VYGLPSSGQHHNIDGNLTTILAPPDNQTTHYLELDFTDLLDFLLQYKEFCPDIIMVCPYNAEPLPHIEVPFSSSMKAKIEMSIPLGEALLRRRLGGHVPRSRYPT